MTAPTTADLTQNVSHEEQLAKLHSEVEALRTQLRHAQRLASLGTLTAMVAHEFNNILTPVVNYAQMAQKNPSLQTKAILRAADGGRRATEICNAILRISRGESAEPETVPVAGVVRAALDVLARDLGKDGIELRLDIAEGLCVRTHPIELEQVLVNLLSNARSAVLKTRGMRRIEVTASPDRDGGVLLCVRDNGTGIAPEHLPRIFEPFFTTADPAAGPGHEGGSGLGLPVCQEIIQHLGGRIDVSSTPGEGAEFRLALPPL